MVPSSSYSFGSVSSSPSAESCCSRLLVVKSENLPMLDAAGETSKAPSLMD